MPGFLFYNFPIKLKDSIALSRLSNILILNTFSFITWLKSINVTYALGT